MANDAINKADRAVVNGHITALNTIPSTPKFTEYDVVVRSGGGGSGNKTYGINPNSRALPPFNSALLYMSTQPQAGMADFYPGEDVAEACIYFAIPIPPKNPQPIKIETP